MLLQALIFKIFGISHFTSFLTVLVFASALIVLSILFIGKKSKFYLLASILLSLLLCKNSAFSYLLTKLYGELPAIFFSMVAFYFLYVIFEMKGRDENKNIDICFMAGIFFGLAVITKLIMIFLILSFLGLVIIDIIIYKNFTIKSFFSIIIGILTVLFFEFLFRLVQFDFSLTKSINSIIDFLNNMYTQSTWSEVEVIDNSSVFDRINKLPEILDFSFFPVLYVVLPVFIYLVYLGFKKKENLLMMYIGVSASSIFVYYIFFGTLALHSKRLFPYTYFLLCYYIYVFLLIVKFIFFKDKLKLVFKMPLIIIIFIVCIVINNKFYTRTWGSIRDGICMTKENKRYREDEYIKILQNIPLNSTIYTISLNTSIMCLYTDLKNFYIFEPQDKDKLIGLVDELLINNKVYLVSDQLDLQIKDLKKYFDLLDSLSIDYIKLNKIQTDDEYDIYGIYELRIKDLYAFINSNIFR